MYDFNIIIKDENGNKIKNSFTIDKDGGIYKYKGGARDYYLTDNECRLIIRAGGVQAITDFLKNGRYADKLEVNGLFVVNCNP